MTEYQPRTPERLVEVLRSHGYGPRTWQAEAADLIERLIGLPQSPDTRFLQFILDGAENVNINHRDFRIQVAQMAQAEMDKVVSVSRPVLAKSKVVGSPGLGERDQ